MTTEGDKKDQSGSSSTIQKEQDLKEEQKEAEGDKAKKEQKEW